jgi:hypothetical protein
MAGYASVVIACTGLVNAAEPCQTGQKGYVGLEQQSGVWWFKSPEGKPFLSIGINHVQVLYWMSPNNLSFAIDTYGPGLFSPKGAFCDGSPAADKWGLRIADNFKKWGFNTLGVHNALHKSLGPVGDYYVVELNIPVPWTWNMPRSTLIREFKKNPFDVFDNAFAATVKTNAAEVVKAYANDPRVLGYAYSDGPPWTVHDDPQTADYRSLTVAEKTIHPWVLALMSLNAETKGKQAWLAIMRGRYTSAESAGATYAFKASTWDELASNTTWSSISDAPRATEDSQAFLTELMRQWYKVRKIAIREYDPNHLILGDKLNMDRDSQYPKALIQSLKAMNDFVDVIYIQHLTLLFDKQRDTLELLYRESQKPIVNGDTSCYYPWKDNDITNVGYYSHLGQTYAREVTSLFSLPYYIGWHHCGYMRGLRPPYVAALKKGDQKAIELNQRNKTTYREGFITEFEEPIDAILTPLTNAIAQCEDLHRASATSKDR